MVDPVFIYMAGSLGRRYAAAEENAGLDKACCLYGGMRGPRFFIRDVICAGTSAFVRTEPERHGGLDHSGTSVGRRSRDKQLFLRFFDRTGRFGAAACRKKYVEGMKKYAAH